MNLQENIQRIKQMMGLINEVIIPHQFRSFVKKHGFKLECSRCDHTFDESLAFPPDERLPVNYDWLVKQDTGTMGDWSTYYLIINVSNNCEYGVQDFDRSATDYGTSNTYQGDAIIIANFSYKKDIINNSEIGLCKTTYPRDIVDNFYEKYNGYIKYKDFDTPDNESYILETNAMPHSVLEEVINFLKTPPKPTVELDKKYKSSNDTKIDKQLGDLT